MQYSSLEHQTLLSPPDTSPCHYLFHPASDVIWLTSSSVISCCLFILNNCFLRQGYYCGLPYPSSAGHILSKLFTMTSLFWLILHGMAHSTVALHKDALLVIMLVSFLRFCGCCSSCFFCLPSDGWGEEACVSFLMGRTVCEYSWVLLWWTRPCSVNLWFNFLVRGGAVLPWLEVAQSWSLETLCVH